MSGNIKPNRVGYKSTAGLFTGTITTTLYNNLVPWGSQSGENAYLFESNISGVNTRYHCALFTMGDYTVEMNQRYSPVPTFFTNAMPTNTNSLIYSIPLENGFYNIYLWQNSSNVAFRIGFCSNQSSNVINATFIGGYQSLRTDYPLLSSPYSIGYGIFKNSNGTKYIGVILQQYYNGKKADVVIGLNYDEFISLKPNKSVDSPTFGHYSTTEGYGEPSFDDSSDTIPIPSLPTYGVTSAGFINAYSVEQNELKNIGADLFPRIEYDPEASIPQLNDTIIKMYTNKNLVDFVLDCHIIPCKPTTTSDTEFVRVGSRNLTQACKKITSDYVHISCGSIVVAEYYNNFIDYVGTNAKLYLPFIGFVPLKNEFFQGGVLSIDYHFNVIDGSFMCYLSSTSSKSRLTNSVIATYSGVACTHIPITGTNYATMVSGIINGSLGTLSGLSSGNVLGAIDSAMNTISSKPDISQSNGYNSSSSLLSPRKPYLLIERTVSNMSETAPSESGLPLNAAYKLSDVTGYTELNNVVVTGITATTNEQDELKRLLESGVIL